jgi:hypothetical protein
MRWTAALARRAVEDYEPALGLVGFLNFLVMLLAIVVRIKSPASTPR